MKGFRLVRLALIVACGSLALVVPSEAQILRKEPARISCGQKILVENQTCPAGEILEVTGSCLEQRDATDRPVRGVQYNCIKRK